MVFWGPGSNCNRESGIVFLPTYLLAQTLKKKKFSSGDSRKYSPWIFQSIANTYRLLWIICTNEAQPDEG